MSLYAPLRERRRASFMAGVRAAVAHRLNGAERPRNPHSSGFGPYVWWRQGERTADRLIDQLLEHAP